MERSVVVEFGWIKGSDATDLVEQLRMARDAVKQTGLEVWGGSEKRNPTVMRLNEKRNKAATQRSNGLLIPMKWPLIRISHIFELMDSSSGLTSFVSVTLVNSCVHRFQSYKKVPSNIITGCARTPESAPPSMYPHIRLNQKVYMQTP